MSLLNSLFRSAIPLPSITYCVLETDLAETFSKVNRFCYLSDFVIVELTGTLGFTAFGLVQAKDGS